MTHWPTSGSAKVICCTLSKSTGVHFSYLAVYLWSQRLSWHERPKCTSWLALEVWIGTVGQTKDRIPLYLKGPCEKYTWPTHHLSPFPLHTPPDPSSWSIRWSASYTRRKQQSPSRYHPPSILFFLILIFQFGGWGKVRISYRRGCV